MRKPASLRAAIVAAIPGLSTDPENLELFIRNGSIAARYGPAGTPTAWEYRYTLSLYLIDFACPGNEEDLVFATLVEWLKVEQPEQLLNLQTGNEAAKFTVDIVSADACDISIDIELTGTVRRQDLGNGRFSLIHDAEPAVVGMDGGVPIAELDVGGMIVMAPVPAG